MARVRAGAEVVIEHDKLPVAVIHAPIPSRRTISECITLAKAHEEETGEVPVMDADFAADMEEIIKNRKVWNPPTWELILDSSVIITAERKGHSVRQILEQSAD